MAEEKDDKKKKDKCCCSTLSVEIYHKCAVRDKVSALLCTMGIIVYILDLYIDLIVGLEDLWGLSQKLGIFEQFLVAFTFGHENYRSSHSVYKTHWGGKI